MKKDIDISNDSINLQKRVDKIDEHLIYILQKIDELNLRPNKREKHDSKRIKKYISFNPEQYEWIESNIESWKFASVTHAVEWGIHILKEKLDKE